MLCFAKRLKALNDNPDVLVIRQIWEWHWFIFGIFVATAVVMFFGVGWVWPTPGSQNTLALRGLLSAGAILSLLTGALFLFAARSDQLIIDRSPNVRRWRVVRRTLPWECTSFESGIHTTGHAEFDGGAIESILAVCATTRTRRELELAIIAPNRNSLAADANDEASTSLLAGSNRIADEKSPATTRAGAASDQPPPTPRTPQTPQTPVAAHVREVDDGPNPNRSCHCGGEGGCASRVLAFQIAATGASAAAAGGRDTVMIPVLEGNGASCTALCCCSDRDGYLDIATCVVTINRFLANRNVDAADMS